MNDRGILSSSLKSLVILPKVHPSAGVATSRGTNYESLEDIVRASLAVENQNEATLFPSRVSPNAGVHLQMG